MTLDRVVRLWLEGYNFTQIAKKTRIARSTIFNHVKQGTLVLPERPWVSTGSMGVLRSTTDGWVRQGLVRKAPSGLLHVEDLRRELGRREGRQCQFPGCEGAIKGRNLNYKFCPLHTVR